MDMDITIELVPQGHNNFGYMKCISLIIYLVNWSQIKSMLKNFSESELKNKALNTNPYRQKSDYQQLTKFIFHNVKYQRSTM